MLGLLEYIAVTLPFATGSHAWWLLLVIAALIVQSLLARQPYGDAYAALATVVMLRMFVLLIPFDEALVGVRMWYPLIAWTTLVLVLVAAKALEYSPHALGFSLLSPQRARRYRWQGRALWISGHAVLQLLLAAGGWLFATQALRYAEPSTPLALFVAEQPMALALGVLLFVGIVEELLLRGLLQHAFRRSLGWLPGLLYPVLLSSLLYSLEQPLPFVAFIAAWGVIAGLLRQLSGSLWGVALARGVGNVLLHFSIAQLWAFYLA